MAVTIELRPEVEAEAAAQAGERGLPLPDYLGKLVESSLQMHRNLAARDVLSSFMDGDAEEQRDTWDALKAGLSEDRLSDRSYLGH